MLKAQIIGTGMYIPGNILVNSHFLAMGLDTSDEWIVSRTGIRQRHIAPEGVFTSDLAANAGILALRDAKVELEEVELLIVATTTPDKHMPATAPLVKQKMGIKNDAPAYDLNAACSSFVFGLADCNAQILQYRTVLLIGADTMSRYLNYDDRSTSILFGDGAGAVVLRPSRDQGVLASRMFTDARVSEYLDISSDFPPDRNIETVRMDGQKVFQFAVKALPKAVNAVLEKTGVNITDISWIISHQANNRILKKAARSLGFPVDRMFSNIALYGNTSAASIPIALHELKPKLKRGDLIVLTGFGAGGTYGAILIEW